MRYRTFAFAAAIVFLLIAIAHAVRILLAVPVTVGEWPVPQWASAAATVLMGFLGVEGLRQARRSRG